MTRLTRGWSALAGRRRTVAADEAAALERADVLAYLARHRRNAEAIFANSAEFADEARVRLRMIALFEGDIGHGLHEGEEDMRRLRAATTRGAE